MLDREYRSDYFKVVVPVTMQTFLTAVLTATDTIMVGMLNSTSLAAVSLASQVTLIITNLIAAISVGTSALASQYYGKKDMESVKKVMYTTFRFSMMLGVFFFLITLLFPKIIMGILTNEPEIISLGAGYLRLLCPSFLFMTFSQIWMIIMKNAGRSMVVTAISTCSGILNFILNAVLIFGLLGVPAMGIKGAALSTTLVSMTEAIAAIVLSRKEKNISIEFKRILRRNRAIRQKFIHYTIPATVQTGSWILANTCIAAIIGHMGSNAVAANAVALLVFGITSSIYNGVAIGSGIIIGKELGSGNTEGAKKHSVWIMAFNVAVGALMCLLILCLRGTIVKAYPAFSVEAKGLLSFMLTVVAIKSIFGSLNNCMSKSLMSTGGDIRYLTIMDIVNMWGVIVPVGLIAAFVLKLPVPVVYILVNLDEVTKFYIQLRRVLTWKWVKDLTRVEWAEPGRSERQLKSRILKEMPVGALVLGSYGDIIYMNDAAGKILQIDTEDAQGRKLLQYFITNGNDDFANLLLDAMYQNRVIHSRKISYSCGDTEKELLLHTMMVHEEDLRLGLCAIIEEA